MKPALFYSMNDGKIKCELCPKGCIYGKDGDIGNCLAYIRKEDGLYSRNYGMISAIALDPIEKKPLYHYFPGSNILSVGTYGCNLHCDFCQNSSISQYFFNTELVYPETLVEKALSLEDNIGIAFTYNEPFIWFEYVLDCAKLLKEKGLKTVLVSNGFINPKPLKKLAPYIDAVNIDIKAFDQEFYSRCGGFLKDVLNTVKILKDNNVHIELTTLIIENLNTDKGNFEELCKFIADVDENIPFHISRYFPSYRSEEPPTDINLLESFENIAKRYLNYVYLGNINKITFTECKNCKNIVAERYRNQVKDSSENGYCPHCKTHIFVKE